MVSLVAYRVSLTSVRHGGNACVGMIFSIFLGIFFVILCIVDSLNLFGIPGFLVGITGRGGGVLSCLSISRCKWTGRRLCTGFVGSIFAASRAAARCITWSSRI